MAAPVNAPNPVAEAARPLAQQPLPQAIATLTSGTQIVATMVGVDAAGRTLLRTEAGNVTYGKKIDAPRGSVVTLEVQQVAGQSILTVRTVTPPAGSEGGQPTKINVGSAGGAYAGPAASAEAAAPPLPAAPAPANAEGDGLVLLRAWPNLVAALRLLSGAHPALADAVYRRLPSPGPDLGLAMARFAALVATAGGAAALLGREATDALRRSRYRAGLESLDHDLARLDDIGRALSPGEWRTVIVPLLTPLGIVQARLMLRGGGTETGETPTRFVLDVLLPDLGPVQLDGLIGEARLDLTLRSRDALRDALKGDIARLFEVSCQRAGMAGSLRFEVAPVFALSPEQELAGLARGTWMA